MKAGARDPRFAAWIAATAVLFIAAAAVGFVWLPAAQPGAGVAGLWATICRAVGLSVRAPADTVISGAGPASNLAWTAATRERLKRGDAARGATLAAATCDNCHGANGVSADAAFPNLAGQDIGALYKQLDDFRSRKRGAAVMGVYANALSPQDMLDIASHFAALRNPFAGATPQPAAVDARSYTLATAGDPLRGIAPCSACHGPAGLVPGAPGLRGQQRAYLEEQMQAFKAGRRRNDLGAQMRSVARGLSDGEVAGLAAYYSSFPAASRP